MTTPGPDLVLAGLSQDGGVISARRQLLARHGVSADPDAAFDTVAHRLAQETGFPYAMVNFLLEQQHFAGLHNPDPDSGLPIVGRDMDPLHGWCPHVALRKLGLPLHNVHASRLYSGNPVVDKIGINSYFGVPLLYPDTGIVLGTVCVIDQQVHDVTEADDVLAIVEQAAADVLADIRSRSPHPR
ncbi:GAF domain-containing protein [Streptomyces broussonetiae]|uniref:GAF domain-containing protein n=1 Tax=Streptomyces broussonetiae TaxID=2686304 RepID=A0ABV5EM98_9ACTN